MQTILPNKDNVKYIGRVMQVNNALWMCYSATGAAFKFSGKKLTVWIQGDDRCQNSGMEGDLARIKIMLNGTCKIDTMITDKENSFMVIDGEETITCCVEILKVSETAMSTCALSKIMTDAEATVSPVPEKDCYIEFAGDSITCGYGVDDEVADHNFKTDTEDATKAYAYLTAQLLNADHSLVSISGYGIISGYSGDGIRRADQLLPTYYEKIGFSYGCFEGIYPQDVAWDFSVRQPDLVVINLGTNDDSFTGENLALQEEYCREYQHFIKTVRRNNPTAKILCMLGIMGERLCPMVEKAVLEYSSETGDQNIRFAHFTEQLIEDGRAADWHPSQLTHRKAAEKLSALVRDYLN